MPFIDGKPRKATEEHRRAPRRGKMDGSAFRCYLCGHRFRLGDVWRFQWAAHEGVQNFLVCDTCDGPDVLQRWKAHVEMANKRCWWMRS